MRKCGKCGADDRAEIDIEQACRCGATAKGEEEHHPECPRLIHHVARRFVQITEKELTPERELPRYYRAQGWTLMQNGGRYFRVRLMCRQCIRDHEQVLSQERDYKRSCKAAQGLPDMTYTQMLARQSY